MIVSDLFIPFIVQYGINLVLLGTIILISTAACLRLMDAGSPRIRYIIAIVSFALAVFAPLYVTVEDSSYNTPAIQLNGTESIVKGSRTAGGENETFDGRGDAEGSRADTFIDLSSATVADASRILYEGQIGIYIVVVWFAVSLFLLVRLLVAYYRLVAKKRTWRKGTAGEKERLMLPQSVALYYAEHQSPFTMGLLWPSIVLPASFPSNVSVESVRCIARHELAHVRWRDSLVNMAIQGVQSLLWINPALWVLRSVIRREQECAADKVATELSESESTQIALDYASSILLIAEFGRGEISGAETSLIGSPVEERIRLILTGRGRPNRLRRGIGIAVLVTGFASLLLVPVASLSTVITEKEMVPLADYPVDPSPRDLDRPERNRVGSLNSRGEMKTLRPVSTETPSDHGRADRTTAELRKPVASDSRSEESSNGIAVINSVRTFTIGETKGGQPPQRLSKDELSKLVKETFDRTRSDRNAENR